MINVVSIGYEEHLHTLGRFSRQHLIVIAFFQFHPNDVEAGIAARPVLMFAY